jgi:Tfp pilus assembly protein FimT
MKSKIGKISAILFSLLVILLSLFIINIVKAQNISNITEIETSQNILNISDHVLENLQVTGNDTVSDEISDNSSSDWGGGNLSQIDETVENVTFEILENETNLTDGQNVTLNQTNETSFDNETSLVNITQNISFNQTNVTDTEENITINQTNETSPGIPDLIEPVFDISFEYPEKITRGETITVKGVAVANSDVKNVVLEWSVPDDLIVSGNMTKSCGDLGIASSCASEIDVKSNFSSNLGIREIKIVVSYEK